LEGIISAAGSLKPERFRETVAHEAAKLRMNLKLTTLSTQSPLPHAGPGEPQTAKLFQLLESLEMRSSLTEARTRYTGQTELF
jgi:DNA polymerase-1